MRLYLFILGLASTVLALQNLGVSLVPSGSGFSVVERDLSSSVGGLTDTNLVWVAANSLSIAELGTMASPYKDIVTGITNGFGKTVMVCPGSYTIGVENEVFASEFKERTIIRGLSKNPRDTRILIANYTQLIAATTPPSITFENLQFCSTNNVWVGGFISSPTADGLTCINCIFESCLKYNMADNQGNTVGSGTFIDCQFYNCGVFDDTYQVYDTEVGVLNNSVVKNCIFTNCFMLPSGLGYRYGVGYGIDVSDSTFISCTADAGGALGDSNVRNSKFFDCTAVTGGAAIYNQYATKSISGCLFTNCVGYSSVRIDLGGTLIGSCFISSSKLTMASGVVSRTGFKYTDTFINPGNAMMLGCATNTGFCSEYKP